MDLRIISFALVAWVFSAASSAQTPTSRATTQRSTPSSAPVEIVELGADRRITGPILKQTDTHLFIDLGFDIVRVPLAKVVRRSSADASHKGKTERRRGIYFEAERQEKSVADGAREVGGAVVRIDTSLGLGSGFITDSEGYIVTNYHVVEDETRVDVTVFVQKANGIDKRVLRGAKVIAINPVMDLALVKVDAPKDFTLPHVFIGDSDGVAVGDRVYAIGTPHGLERTVSEGIISVPNQHFWGRLHIQTTTAINPGNSGGPLFNLRGEVVAVNTLSRRGDQGLNFSIPSKYVKEFLANRESFALDSRLPENGIHYLPAPPRRGKDNGTAQKPAPTAK